MRSFIASINIPADLVEYMLQTKTGVVGNIAETKRWIMGNTLYKTQTISTEPPA